MWWDEISTSVKSNGQKKYLKSFATDSNFLREDILAFLNSRSWEKGGGVALDSKNDDFPF